MNDANVTEYKRTASLLRLKARRCGQIPNKVVSRPDLTHVLFSFLLGPPQAENFYLLIIFFAQGYLLFVSCENHPKQYAAE